MWSTRRLDPVFYCYRQCELHFFLEIITQIAFKNGVGDKINSHSRFFVKSVAHELNLPINRWFTALLPWQVDNQKGTRARMLL